MNYLPSSDRDTWPVLLQSRRSHYEALKSKFIVNPTELAKEAQDWTFHNPLSQSEDVSQTFI